MRPSAGCSPIIATWLLFTAFAPGAMAQVTVAGDVSCPACTISVRDSVTLRGLEAEGLPPDGAVIVWPDGFIAGPTIGGGRIILYDRLGEVRDTLGRRGLGPGEFSDRLQFAHHRGDTIAVVDDGQRRLTFVTPSNAVAIPDPESARLPVRPLFPPFANWVFQEGHWITSGIRPELREVGVPLHAISRSGEVVRSFGETDRVYRQDRPWMAARALARAQSGLWALHYNAYVLEEFDRSWERRRVFHVESPWFTEWDEYPPGAPFRNPPPPEFAGMWEGETGLIWTVAQVPAGDWQRTSTDEAELVIDVVDASGMYDTMFEVLDLDVGAVVARRRLRGRLLPTATPGWVVRPRYAADGDIVYDVMRMDLDGSRP